LGKKLDEEHSRIFFESGVHDTENLIETIKTLNNGVVPRFKKAVDFGCGVGRLSIPLLEYSRSVVGLDVSPSMIEEAKRNIPREPKNKIEYFVSDDRLTKLPESYDLMHSSIVLQHIPVERGEKLIAELLKHLEKGGFAALQVTYEQRVPRLKKLILSMRESWLPVHYLFNVLRGRSWNTPLMRMHVYDLNKVMGIFYSQGIKDVHRSKTTHGDYRGVMLVGKKNS
jgi:SAM-dependent methyltransferase